MWKLGSGTVITYKTQNIALMVMIYDRNSRRSIKLDKKEEEKGSKKSKVQSLKYTAAKLHEKGVILEIEGLQTNQYDLLFTMGPTLY